MLREARSKAGGVFYLLPRFVLPARLRQISSFWSGGFLPRLKTPGSSFKLAQILWALFPSSSLRSTLGWHQSLFGNETSLLQELVALSFHPLCLFLYGSPGTHLMSLPNNADQEIMCPLHLYWLLVICSDDLFFAVFLPIETGRVTRSQTGSSSYWLKQDTITRAEVQYG